VKLCSSNQSIK